MADTPIYDEDTFQNDFFYFAEALRLLANEAERQCEHMPDGRIPWDLKDDAHATNYFINQRCFPFTDAQKALIISLMAALDGLPDTALYVGGSYSKANCKKALSHPAWELSVGLQRISLKYLPSDCAERKLLAYPERLRFLLF